MPDAITIDRMLTSEEAGRLLGMGKSWLYDQAARGTIPCYRFGRSVRFRLSDLERYMAAQRVDMYPSADDCSRETAALLTPARRSPPARM